MRFYEWLTIGFYLVFAVLAWYRRLATDRRSKATAIAVGGLCAIAAAAVQSQVHPMVGMVARNWLPVILIPMAYWQPGQFVLPLNKVWQTKLQQFDQKPLLMFIRFPADSPAGKFMNSVLELSYVFCYPILSPGLGTLYLRGM